MTTNIDGLARDWLEAKASEQEAQKRRYGIEAEIAKALETKSEGAITHKLEEHKVTLTQPVTRKLDAKKWEMVKQHCPPALHPVKTKIEPDVTGCKWLAENEPGIWRDIADAFETKPGKIGVKVERL